MPEAIDRVQFAALGKEPIVAIGNPRRQFAQRNVTLFVKFGIAQHDKAGIEPLGQHALADGMGDQSAREIELANTCPAPRNHFGSQHAMNAKLLAKPGQEHVDAGGIDVGEFRQIADAEHHARFWIAPADFEASPE